LTDFHHITVLKNELVEMMAIQPDGTYVDCTCGGGGHLSKILSSLSPSGKVIGIDRDPDAIAHLRMKFSAELASGQLDLVQAPFSQVHDILVNKGLFGQINGLCADIGVSSHQIDQPARGFSFSKPGPLDMRMGYDSTAQTAAEFLGTCNHADLVSILREFGEIDFAPRLAERILTERAKSPLATTSDLFRCVEIAIPGRLRPKTNQAAAQVFQAIRIHINDELGELKTVIEDGFGSLAVKGRLCLIAFHSLEDRLVKHAFHRLSGKSARENLPRELPLASAQVDSVINMKAKIIKPFPIKPTAEETKVNPRSRSARLRTLEKI
jgi:16S rRNA (cytosine1402-N4)-methyltransferase